MKTNKNGVKLLAAIMVFAMAFAGCIVIFNSEESSAASIEDTVQEAPRVIETLSNAVTYKVTTDGLITFNETNEAVTLYVASGVTVTITGKLNGGSIIIQAASASGKSYTAGDSAITINTLAEAATQSLSVKATYVGSSVVKSTLTISGNTTAEFTVTGDVTVGTNGLTTVTGNSGFTYGSKFVKNGATTADYSAVGSNKTFGTVAAGDVVTIVDGNYTVTVGENTIRFNKFSTAAVGGVTVSGTGAALAGGAAEDQGTITIITGQFGASSVATGAFVGVGDGDNVMNQIPKNAAGSVTYTVYGEYRQNTAIDDATNITIALNANAIMVVPENISVNVKTLNTDTDSILKVFGSFTSTDAGTNDGKVQSGVFGTVSLPSSDKADANTNVTSGPDKGLSGDISGDIQDAVLMGDAYIPAGKTLTINGYFGLSGYKLTIQGTLVVNTGAAVYTLGKNASGSTETIVLTSTGTITNNGSFGTIEKMVVSDNANTPNKITISGITGAQFGFATLYDGVTKVISISGDISTSGLVTDDGKAIGTITLAVEAAISGTITIGNDITLAGTDAEIVAGSDVTVDGVLSGTFTAGYGVAIDVNGKLAEGSSIKFKSGALDGAGRAGAETAIAVTNDDATGFKLYSEKIKTSTGGYEVDVYITGTIEDGTIQQAADPLATEDHPTVAITGTAYVPADGLAIGKSNTFTVGKLVLGGTFAYLSSENVTVTDYIGAKYDIKGSDSKITTYYTTLETAMENIDSAQNKTVTAKVTNVTSVITIANGQTLNITISKDIKKGASIIAEVGSKPTITLSGKLIGSIEIYKGVVFTPTFTADATIVSDEKTVYAGFVTAVDMASAGDTLTVGTVESDESLTIKEGITLIADSLTVKGNLTVPETSTLKASSIIMKEPTVGTKAQINVLGTLDLSTGSISAETGEYVLKSTGKTILVSIDTNTMSGAYYTTEDGFVLTTIGKAVDEATEGEIVIIGKISDKTDITLDGIDLRVSGTEVTLGNITLKDAKVIAEGKLTATIISNADAATTGAADASVSIVGATITVQDIETGLQINNIAGKVKAISGVITVSGAATIADADSELTVAKDAQALVSGSLTASAGKITVDGELAVKGTVSLTNIVPTVNGTLTAQAGSTVTVPGAKVTGTVIAEETSAFNITDSKVSVAEGGKIVGEFALTSAKYVKAFAGADVSTMEFAGDVDSTAFYVNNDLIETLYFDSTVAFDADLKTVVYNDLKNIPEIDLGSATAATLVWKDSDGVQVTAGSVNDVSALYAKVDFATADVKVSIGTGISLWIDGVKQVTADTAKLTIGEHQVQVTINPGYKGTATIAFNGATVSNGKIVITADMVGAVNVITATGDITIDSGDTPAPVEPTEKDNGMGITDYLLIVLVVLAAVLVVIVAIRMMRS